MHAYEHQDILRNSARCLICLDEIESFYDRHHTVYCSCKNVMVDGGRQYIRHGWDIKDAYENTSIFTTTIVGNVDD